MKKPLGFHFCPLLLFVVVFTLASNSQGCPRPAIRQDLLMEGRKESCSAESVQKLQAIKN